MLAQGVRETAQFSDRLTFIWQDARNLPFHNNVFDAVTCLEALEFTPRPSQVLEELVRVLRPGGVLLVTNRIGPQAKLLPSRAYPRDEFLALLGSLDLEDTSLRLWQVDYDLVWAVKAGQPRGGGIRPLPEVMRCPVCRGSMERGGDGYHCTECTREYPVAHDGVIEMARVSRRTT
jgi:SAM-dependent methyltransferase